jgi:hypothetical protein
VITDTEIRIKGFRMLLEALGEVEAERFISLILHEPFDYTKWQRNLLTDKTVAEISNSAMRMRTKAETNKKKQ